MWMGRRDEMGFEKEEMQEATPPSTSWNAFLGKGCTFEGKLTFEGTVKIAGEFRGEIRSGGKLVVDKGAKILGMDKGRASIEVGEAEVAGHIKGNIVAKKKLHLKAGAVVIGDIKTPTLVVEQGAKLHGRCEMLEEKTAAAERVVVKPRPEK